MELSSKKACNDQQKNRLVAKIGAGGGVGAVILLGGAFAMASAFIVRRKGRSSSTPETKIQNDEQPDDDDLDKNQVQVFPDDKLSSDEVTKEIVECNVLPLVSSQSFKSDVIDAEKPSEENTLDVISPGEKNYFPDGSVVKKENSGFLNDKRLSSELENVIAEKFSDEISSEREEGSTDNGRRELPSEMENVAEKFSDEISTEREDTDKCRRELSSSELENVMMAEELKDEITSEEDADNCRRDGEHDGDGEVEEMNCEEAADVIDISPRSGESMEVCCDDECDEDSIALTAIHEALHGLRVDEIEEENHREVEVNIDEGFGGHYGDNGDIWEANSETNEEQESDLVADNEADQGEGVTTPVLSALERGDIDRIQAESNLSNEVDNEDTRETVDSDNHARGDEEMIASYSVENGKKDCLVPNEIEGLENGFKHVDKDSSEDEKEKTCNEADNGEIRDAESETNEEKESDLIADTEADQDEGEVITTMASAPEKVHIGGVEANNDLSKEVDSEDTRETAVSDSHIGDGEETLFPMSASNNVENDKEDCVVPNEILGLKEEVMQENSITEEGVEDQYKHVGEDIAEEQKAEMCNEAGLVDEADHIFLQPDLHIEPNEEECSYTNKEENATPENPELGDHDKNVENLHMAVLEKELIFHESIQATADEDVESNVNEKDDISEPVVCQQKDCNDGAEQTIREEAQAESTDMTMGKSEDEETGDEVVNINSTDEDEDDEVEEMDSSEVEESSLGTRDSSTESNTEDISPTDFLQIIDQEVDGKTLEDKLIATQTGFKNKSSDEIKEERDSVLSKPIMHKSFEGSNTPKPTENSIKKYAMEMKTLVDHPGNAKARMMLIVMLSLLSSYLCSRLFDCSFTKLTLIVFFTVALSKIRSY